MHRLTLRRPGQDDAADVRIRRAFPWSQPGRHISIRSSDGKELLLIEDFAGLAPDLRAHMTSGGLDTHSFIPRITRIIEVDVRFGYQQWQVQTDRGPRSNFACRSGKTSDFSPTAGSASAMPTAMSMRCRL